MVVENEALQKEVEPQSLVSDGVKLNDEAEPLNDIVEEKIEEAKEEEKIEKVVEEKKDEKEDVKEESEEEIDFDIKNKLVSWGYTKSSTRTIDTIVVHSSYNALGGDEYDTDLLIKEYKEYGVSPHYLIDRKGKVYRLVEDKNVAYHAGVSETPDGREGVNAFSIGVELINNKEDEYTKAQYSSLNNLIDYLEGKYKMKYILGHDEISPGRKTDPWNMNWKKVDR
ncbi:MAG: N-acetylmuramoyl-L-alanine amidase [Candidatus Moranbacteria bacterium]|nr:N-acetylmuramoyl-L-alanine amidase [Candidatus Moranbacteria bacterium]